MDVEDFSPGLLSCLLLLGALWSRGGLFQRLPLRQTGVFSQSHHLCLSAAGRSHRGHFDAVAPLVRLMAEHIRKASTFTATLYLLLLPWHRSGGCGAVCFRPILISALAWIVFWVVPLRGGGQGYRLKCSCFGFQRFPGGAFIHKDYWSGRTSFESMDRLNSPLKMSSRRPRKGWTFSWTQRVGDVVDGAWWCYLTGTCCCKL